MNHPVALEKPSAIGGQLLRNGAVAAFVCSAGALIFAFGGAGSVVEYAFPVAVVSLAYVFLRKGDDVAYLEFILWLWLVSPALRRVVDYTSSYHDPSAVLVAPYLAALLSLPWAWRRRQEVSRSAYAAFLVGFACIGFATFVGLFQNPPTQVLASLLTWLPPLALGFFLLMSAADRDRLQAMLIRFIPAALLLLGTYGVIQWILVPAWDVAWLENVILPNTSFGVAEPYELRIWSLFNGPGPLASLLVFLLICQLGGQRGFVPAFGASIALATLAISNVRAAWIAGVLSLALLAWRGGFGVMRIALTTSVAVALLVLSGGPIGEQISERVESLASGTSDESASARLVFQAEQIPASLSNLAGSGMGSTGAGVRAGGEAGSSQFRNTDSGYLEVLRTFGPVAGVLLLLAALAACVAAYIGARRSDNPFAIAMSAAVAVIPISMFFGLAFSLTTWIGLGLLGRADFLDPPPSAGEEPGPAR